MTDEQQAPEPCPWCGQEPIITGSVEFSWRVECDWLACGVRPKTLDSYRTKQFAIAAWNERKPPAESKPIHPAVIAIRNEVYDAALAELCDPDVMDDPNTAGRLATAIADRSLEYLSTITIEQSAGELLGGK